MYQLLLADTSSLLKKYFRKTSLFVLTVTVVMEESVLLVAYFKLLSE